MEYLTVQEIAEKWGVSQRMVQQFCMDGRVPGARKFTRAWAIPADAEKPRDPRSAAPTKPPMLRIDSGNFMPLMNTPFAPGHCLEAAETMAEGPKKDIAMAEYHYFTGMPAAAAKEAEAYLVSEDIGTRLSACLLYAYANLSLGRVQRTRFALQELNAILKSRQSPEAEAASAFTAAAGAVLLHLPLPEGLPDVQGFLPLLPPGLRGFALYVFAHYRYLQGDYGPSAGIVEGALAMGAGSYPIPAIYLHLVAAMNYMSLKQTDKAKKHLLAAWTLAQADDLIEGFGEHHGLLGGLLEAVIKPQWPEDFRRVIDITYRFSAGWRKVHNPVTGHDVADDLTTTEFAVCMLAARNWTNQDIADHMNISPNTVKRYISISLEKLHVRRRQDLKQFMLL